MVNYQTVNSPWCKTSLMASRRTHLLPWSWSLLGMSWFQLSRVFYSWRCLENIVVLAFSDEGNHASFPLVVCPSDSMLPWSLQCGGNWSSHCLPVVPVLISLWESIMAEKHGSQQQARWQEPPAENSHLQTQVQNRESKLEGGRKLYAPRSLPKGHASSSKTLCSKLP